MNQKKIAHDSDNSKTMNTIQQLFAIIIIASWLGTATAMEGREQDLADKIIKAEVARRPIPVLSLRRPAMDVEMAYGIQRAYIERRLKKGSLAGFKAGLTARKGQKRFGLDAPIAGALLESGRVTTPIIESDGFRRPMVETEIGFIIGAPLTHPVKSASALLDSIRAIAPVIELPDLGFAKTEHLAGTDIIAANACAKQFIVGPPQPVERVAPNTTRVVLFLDGREINRGKGSEALGDQWQAALWLVNTMIAQGWRMEPGQILLTGALGKMLPAKPGKYRADYGKLGEIRFEILPRNQRRGIE